MGTLTATKILVSAIVAPIYSRLLGIQGYGEYAYYVALLLLISQPANFGMRQTLTKYIAERPQNAQWQREAARFAGSVNIITSGITGLGVAMFMLTALQVESFPFLLTAVIIGLMIAEQILQYASGILYGLHREEEATVPASIGVVLSAVFGVFLAAGGFGTLGLLIGMLASGFLVGVVSLRVALRAIGQHLKPERAMVTVQRRDLLQFGFSTMVYGGFAITLLSIDVVLVRHLAGEAQTGLYAAAAQCSQFVWFVPLAVEGALLQTTARLWSQGHAEEITRVVSRLMRYVALSATFLLLFVFVFSEHIVMLYFGPEFSAAARPLQFLVPGAFAFSLLRIIKPVIEAKGAITVLMTAVAAATGIKIILNMALVPMFGAAGASVATSISFVSLAGAYAGFLHAQGLRAFAGFSGTRFFWLCALNSALLLPIAWAIPSPAVAIGIGGIVALIVYWPSVFLFGLIRVRELEQIIDSLPEVVRPFALKLWRLVAPAVIRLDAWAF